MTELMPSIGERYGVRAVRKREAGEETRQRFVGAMGGIKAEPLGHNAASRYSKFVTFRDGSCVAQVRGSRRWEVWG